MVGGSNYVPVRIGPFLGQPKPCRALRQDQRTGVNKIEGTCRTKTDDRFWSPEAGTHHALLTIHQRARFNGIALSWWLSRSIQLYRSCGSIETKFDDGKRRQLGL